MWSCSPGCCEEAGGWRYLSSLCFIGEGEGAGAWDVMGHSGTARLDALALSQLRLWCVKCPVEAEKGL